MFKLFIENVRIRWNEWINRNKYNNIELIIEDLEYVLYRSVQSETHINSRC